MKKILFLLIIFSSYFYASAQQDVNQWRVGLYGGVMGYQGDLSNKWLDPNDQLINIFDHTDYLSYGISVEKNLSKSWGLRLMYLEGQFIANDRSINWDGKLQTDKSNFSRALNVKTELTDWSILASYYFDNDKLLSKKAFVAPYLSAGMGWSKFKTFGDLYFSDGGRYHYWSDGSIRTMSEVSGETGQIIEQDGTFETELSKLKTEGNNYSTSLFHATLGLGFKFRLSQRFNLNLETLVHYTDTDYLDDVSGKYLLDYSSEAQRYAAQPGSRSDEYRGNKNDKNDIYHFTSLSLHYNFGRKKEALNVPIIRIGQFSELPLEEEKPNTVEEEEVVVQVSNPDTQAIYLVTVEVDSAYLVTEVDEVTTNTEVDTIMKVGDQIYTIGKEKNWDEEDEDWQLIRDHFEGNEYPIDSLNQDQIAVADTQVIYLLRKQVDSTFVANNPNIDWEEKWWDEMEMDTFYQVGKEILNADLTEPVADDDWAIIRDEYLHLPDSLDLDLQYEDYLENFPNKKLLDTIPNTIEEEPISSIFEPIDLDKIIPTPTPPTELPEEKVEDIDQEELIIKSKETEINPTQKEQPDNTDKKSIERIANLERQLDSLKSQQAKFENEKAFIKNQTTTIVPEPTKQTIEPNKSDELAKQRETEITELKKVIDRLENQANQKSDPQLEKMKLQALLYELETKNKTQAQNDNQELKAEIEALKSNIAAQQKQMPAVAATPTNTNDAELIQLKNEMVALNQSMELMKQLLVQQQMIATLKDQSGNEKQSSEEITALRNEVAELKAKQAIPVPPVVVQTNDEDNKALDEMAKQVALLQEQLKEANNTKLPPAPPKVEDSPPIPKVVDVQSMIKGREKQVVFFALGTSSLSAEGMQQVQSVAQLMLQYDVLLVSLEAYTDASGNAEKNLILSKKRALAVSESLQKMGVATDRIKLDYRGEDLQSNAAYGRRVEIKLSTL